MSANFKRVWYSSCVKCGKKGPLIDGDERPASKGRRRSGRRRSTLFGVALMPALIDRVNRIEARGRV